MMKKLALAAVLAISAAGLTTTSADAGYGHRSYGYKAHSYGYKSYGYSYRYYKPVYTYYKPVYSYYKPACHYGWTYKHGHKVWACIW